MNREQARKKMLADIKQSCPSFEWTGALENLLESAWFHGSTYELDRQLAQMKKDQKTRDSLPTRTG